MFDTVISRSKSYITKRCLFPLKRYPFFLKVHICPFAVNEFLQYEFRIIMCFLAIIPYLQSTDLLCLCICNGELRQSVIRVFALHNLALLPVSCWTCFRYAVSKFLSINLNRQTTDYCIPNLTACIFFPRNCLTGICLLNFLFSGCSLTDNGYCQSLC